VIARVAAAVVAVADQDVMLEFFVGKLGFTTVMDREMWPGARWVEVAPLGGSGGSRPPTSVVLSAAKDFDREPDPAYPMTFAAADLAATAAELRAAGVEVTHVVTEPWGSYIRVTDPEGRQLLVNDRV
jgi:catechol 2,3-dioxygenase-like lactoylglutathione lyase family enzyme